MTSAPTNNATTTTGTPGETDDEGRRVLVVGEALVDIVRRHDGEGGEHVGGSPLNVALGLSRLGEQVDFATLIGTDERGERIAEHVAAGGVTLTPGSTGAPRTSTAIATLDESGAATYAFDLDWNLPPVVVAERTTHLHTGSIAAVLQPGDRAVQDAVLTVRSAGGTVSYDPNVRPQIMTDLDDARTRIEATIALSDVVKASDEDLATLYPDRSVAQVVAAWAATGPALVVVTRGPDGVEYAVASGDRDEAPTRAEQVVDTVGAGDSFMAGLVSGLLEAGLLGSDGARERLRAASLDHVRPAIERGLACSAATVARAGAYSPALAEL